LLTLFNNKAVIVSNPDEIVKTGFYNLLSDPTIKFDPHHDKKPIGSNNVPRILVQGKCVETQTDSNHVMKPQENDKFPLQKSQMNELIDQMLHLISTIPPRYIKYNKLLSKQIDISLEETQSWINQSDAIYKSLQTDSPTTLHHSGVSLGIFLTFVQYRILNMLHDIWKRVWMRFSPQKRVFNVSKLYTLHSLQKVEHALNCLSSWRRILDEQSFLKLKYHFGKKLKWEIDRTPTRKSELLSPPRLVSDENCGDFVHVSQDCPNVEEVRSKEEVLDIFRKEFVKGLNMRDVYKNREMVIVLNELLAAKEHDYPTNYIRHTIKNEFKLSG
jgi:hypothetical protein